MSNRQQRVILSGVTLLVLGLGIAGFITLLGKLEIVKAREIQQDKEAIKKNSLGASLLPKPETVKPKEVQPDKVVMAKSSLGASLLPKPKIVKPRKVQPNKVARANSWLAASFPVENFQAYTSPFGYRPSATGGSNWEFHGGLDIATPQGSYIRNWWGGTVIKVGDRDACGTHLVIKSGEWQHTYCHMEGYVETTDSGRYLIDSAGGIQIWEGQQIPTGVRIGRVGMTGRTTGPHLHWGLKYDNNYVDPALVLREMFSQQQVVKNRASRVNRQQSQVIIQESKSTRDSGY